MVLGLYIIMSQKAYIQISPHDSNVYSTRNGFTVSKIKVGCSELCHGND